MHTRRPIRALLVVLAFVLATAGTAGALLAPVVWTPWKVDATTVRGQANVVGDCGGYITCSFHTTLERSSWSGYRTVDGSKINQRLGLQYPSGRLLSGTYNYKTHFLANVSQFGPCGLQWCIKYATVTLDSNGKNLTRG